MAALAPSSDSSRAPSGLRRWAGLARSFVLYRARPWRQRERIAFYRRFVKPGDLCFDVGAHLGNHTAAWLTLGARVVAIEPQPDFATFLQRHYGKRSDVTLVAKALGAEIGQATLHTSALTPTVSTLSEDWIESVSPQRGFAHVDWEGRLPVAVTTLDSLIEAHGLPAFCKIDVEGHEAAVLTGLSRPLPRLSFEILPAALPVALACLDRLGALGHYRYNLSLGERPRLLLPDWCDAAALRDHLARLGPDSRSGDVYACLAS